MRAVCCFLKSAGIRPPDICVLLEKAGFAGITVKQDLAGLDRVVYGHLL